RPAARRSRCTASRRARSPRAAEASSGRRWASEDCMPLGSTRPSRAIRDPGGSAVPTSEPDIREACQAQLPHALERVSAPPPSRHGRVRELYERGDELLLVATDRVSAYDVVLGTIPFKGALLTEQAAFWLERAKEVVPTHLLDRPDPQVMRVRRATPF